ncbi:MAG TPA: glycosyltransferase family 2 protein [Bryobacteraceae bacterium]|jgi:glycosyltransferase involved in cell wall biosynthesis|nr:glycosyltransferase family 2 protein [Bryobacteraceae bacterium]
MNIAVLIPCHNEEQTIASVVQSFRSALPSAVIYVYDNNSKDATARIAAEAGAIVRHEPAQGKGSVVRRMFAEIDAGYYVLVDGDDTYDASIAPKMLAMAAEQRLAMLVGRRVAKSSAAYRSGHHWGNRMFTRSIAILFGSKLHDILSGYRVLSREFVKSIPVFSRGFEIETELTVHALTLRLPIDEIATVYKERPDGSASKLNKYTDGTRILWTIFTLTKNEQPFLFFSAWSLLFLIASLVLAYPVVVTFLETGLVPRFPTAILATGLTISALVLFACGLILDTVTKGRREMKLLHYLNASKQ